MSRLQIKNKTFRINNPEVKSYFGNEVVTHSNLTTTQSRLKNKENQTDQDRRVLDWITEELEKVAKEIYNRNEIKGEISDGNGHKDRHKKDQGTKPPKVTGSVYKSLQESLNNEISEIKYLIEYLTNNNKNNIN
jgi:hypothetical protein